MNSNEPTIHFTSIAFKNYKALPRFSVSLSDFNVLVGPNNCGKSTIIGAFSVLFAGIRRANSYKPEWLSGTEGGAYGYTLSAANIPISLENVHTDYEDEDTEIIFRLSNKNRLKLLFPASGGVILFLLHETITIKSISLFRQHFPVSIALIPILGPVEHNEVFVREETVRRELSTHRASRHFRSYWHYYPDGFQAFSDLVKKSWPGMEILPPEDPDFFNKTICMFCRENRIDRELYWAGYGFQIWCQLLTHISRSKSATILVIDEPEIYLHPDVQRQLHWILKGINCDVILATHSTEIIAEVDPSDILLIDKSSRSAKRLGDIDEVQSALETIGSIQNITLTKLAQNRRVVFVEDEKDFQRIRRFAKILGYEALSSSMGITPVNSEGLGNWRSVRSTGWGLSKTLGKDLKISAVYDRDFYCTEDIDSIITSLSKHLDFVYFHDVKEMENYLLNPAVLEKACKRAIADRDKRSGVESSDVVPVREYLEKISERQKTDILSQYAAKQDEYFRSAGIDSSSSFAAAATWLDSQWISLDDRMKVVSGKKALKEFRTIVKDNFKITLTDFRIIDSFNASAIPQHLKNLVKELDEFRTSQ